MSNPATLAKAARERLAQALSALQGDPPPPQALLDLADPIAESMGILHRIERSNGADLAGREIALGHIRGALNALQQMSFDHPALDLVMEQVAGCLASVHQLSRYQPPAPQPAPPQPPPQAPAASPPLATPQQASHDGAVTVAAPAGYAAAAAATVPVALGGTQVLAAPAPVAVPTQPVAVPQAAYQPPPPAPTFQTAPVPVAPVPASTQPIPGPQPPVGANHTVRMQPGTAQAIDAAVQATVPAAYAQPAHHAAPSHQAHHAPAAARPAPASQASPSQSGNVVVELGTHSVSNFYKGLGGNDVIEHGGIFVATYKIPKMGAQVNLRVLLPGDYEFQASGVVQWIREPHSGGDSSEPGFGARFVQITPEGRQLVYRYTRNREPMFYDDL